MCVAGTIRGSIAFGLAVSMVLDNKLHKAIIASSTLGLVMITTLLFGAILPFVIKLLKSLDDSPDVKALELKDPVLVVSTFENEVHEEEVVSDKIFQFTHPNFKEK